MKGIILYFSATGNTRKIAKSVHLGMKNLIEDCDIATIKDIEPQDMEKYDLIGIGSPIWGFREPVNLRLFLYNMPQLDGKLCFPFCVHGAAPVGFMFSVVPMLKKKRLTIIGYKDWYGSVSQVRHMPKPYLTDGHPDEVDLEEARDFGKEMAERAHRIVTGENNLIPELPKGKTANPLWRPFDPGAKPEEKGFSEQQSPLPQRRINMEKCKYPECIICEDNCPVKAIDLSAAPPVFKKNCINCTFCNKMCPVDAIEILSDSKTSMHSTKRRINMEKCRYPDCTLCLDHCPMHAIDFSVTPPVFKWNCEKDDLCWAICPEGAVEVDDEAHNKLVGMKDTNHPFAKFLEEEEANGRFRRLVPLNKIGWDNPVYKANKHPVVVIQED